MFLRRDLIVLRLRNKLLVGRQSILLIVYAWRKSFITMTRISCGLPPGLTTATVLL